jgi:hypothetical protein
LPTSSNSIFGHLIQFGARFRTSGPSHKPPAIELPLRSELFSADQMERHGKTLAAAHRPTPRRARDQLLPRLAANESVLIGVCRRLTAAASAKHRYRETYYHIAVRRTETETDEELGAASVTVDGVAQEGQFVLLPTIARNTGSRCVLRPDVRFHN